MHAQRTPIAMEARLFICLIEPNKQTVGAQMHTHGTCTHGIYTNDNNLVLSASKYTEADKHDIERALWRRRAVLTYSHRLVFSSELNATNLQPGIRQAANRLRGTSETTTKTG